MAIAQGIPISTSGIHPFVAIMANGQQSIDRSIQAAGQSISQGNAISSQYIRDAIQGSLDRERLNLQKEAQAQQTRVQEAQLSLQEKAQAQREREFGATMAARERSEQRSAGYQSRQMALQEMKLKREERIGQIQEQILGQVLGGGRDPMAAPQAAAPQVSATPASFDLTSVVSDQDVEGNPIANPTTTLAPVATQQPVAVSEFDRLKEDEVNALRLTAAMNPTQAGYSLQKIAQIRQEQALARDAASKGGPAGQVASIVNSHITPFAGLVDGPVSRETLNKAWESTHPATKVAFVADDQAFDNMLKDGVLDVGQGQLPVGTSDLYKVRDTLNRELSARDKGAAEARFLATREFKEPGDQFVTERLKADPHFSRIEQRRNRIDDLLNEQIKQVGQLPSKEALSTMASAANSVKSDREYLAQQERVLQSQWESQKDADGKFTKVGLGKSIAKKIPGTSTKVGDWDISALAPSDKDKNAEAAKGFNQQLKKYIEFKRELDVKEKNLRSSLDIMGRKGFETDVEKIRLGVFGGNTATSEEEQLNQRDEDDFREAQGQPRMVPSIMDDWNSRR